MAFVVRNMPVNEDSVTDSYGWASPRVNSLISVSSSLSSYFCTVRDFANHMILPGAESCQSMTTCCRNRLLNGRVDHVAPISALHFLPI